MFSTRLLLWTFLAALAAGNAPDSASAGAWTQPEGHLWVKVGGIYALTDELYAAEPAVLPDGTVVEVGDRRPYDDGGTSRQRLILLDAEFGVTDRWTLGAQVPYYDLRFEDATQITDSWGNGDIRLITRYGLLMGRQRLTVRGAVKLATGSASTDPDQIPVGEGQTDVELSLQWGYGLNRHLSWVGVESGYRLRTLNEESDRDPGDEFFWQVEGGYGFDRNGRVGLKVAWTGLLGGSTTSPNFGEVESFQRRFQRVEAVLMTDVGIGLLEVGWNSTYWGRQYPAGTGWAVGLSRTFALFGG